MLGGDVKPVIFLQFGARYLVGDRLLIRDDITSHNRFLGFAFRVGRDWHVEAPFVLALATSHRDLDAAAL